MALLLERLDDLEKPEVIGRLYRAKLERRISFEELQRFCMIVERAYLPDLATWSHFRPGYQVNETAAPHLNALGLVSQTGEDYGTFDGLGAKTWYEVNDLGRKFLAVAYPEHGA